MGMARKRTWGAKTKIKGRIGWEKKETLKVRYLIRSSVRLHGKGVHRWGAKVGMTDKRSELHTKSNSISSGWVKSCENKYKVTRSKMHFGRQHYYRAMQRTNLTKSSGYSGRNVITTVVLRSGLNTGAESVTDPSRKVHAALRLGDKTLWQLTLTQKTKPSLQFL